MTAAAARALTVVMRRLTHAQYNNTVADLLGDRTRPANQFPPEDVVNGFTNQAAGQSISPLMAVDYARAAGKLARNAARSGALARLIPCDKARAGCGAEFVRSFGERAFRRPLTEREVGSFVKLLGADFDAVTVVEAMLQVANVGRNDVVYDLGCGDGKVTVLLKDVFLPQKLRGFDVNPALVRRARGRGFEAAH